MCIVLKESVQCGDQTLIYQSVLWCQAGKWRHIVYALGFWLCI